MKILNYKGIILECQRCIFKVPGVTLSRVGVSITVKENYDNHKHEVVHLFPFEKRLPETAHDAYIIWPTRPHVINPRLVDGKYILTFDELREAWANGEREESD